MHSPVSFLRKILMQDAPAALHCLLALLAAMGLASCGKTDDTAFPGYVEAEYVRLAAPIGGTLAKVYLARGGKVAASAPAFVLEQASERSEQAEARFRVGRAEAQLADLKQGKRPDELQAIRAQLAQARAALAVSTADFQRTSRLVREQFMAPAALDHDRANMARDQARVDEINANLQLALRGARTNEVGAAEQEVKAAGAQAAQVEWKVGQKTQYTPVAADVVDVLFREGEWVPPGSAVVTLLPPGNIKARFFVPQAVAGGIRIGQAVELSCDGCPAPIAGRISYVASEAEYTSPIIYSKENRAKLVFMVEARPDAAQATRLKPGQPLEVRLKAGGAGQ